MLRRVSSCTVSQHPDKVATRAYDKSCDMLGGGQICLQVNLPSR